LATALSHSGDFPVVISSNAFLIGFDFGDERTQAIQKHPISCRIRAFCFSFLILQQRTRMTSAVAAVDTTNLLVEEIRGEKPSLRTTKMIVSKAEAMNPNWRATMEDLCVIHPAGTWGAPNNYMAYFGIYDGHGGA
jgi:hypothetical protein